MSKSTRFAAYTRRNATLKKLNYETYADYLCSNRWQNIRAKVLKNHNHKCAVCGDRATQVHHTSYARMVLLGRDLSYLVPVCAVCHELSEIDPRGFKRSLKDANIAMLKLGAMAGTRPVNRCEHCLKNVTKKNKKICGLCKRLLASSAPTT